MPSIHFEIPKQKVKLRAEYLNDMTGGHDTYCDAELIAVSSYPGHVPTFTALIEGQYLFHYLPINAFVGRPCSDISLSKACYFNCPSTEVAVSVLNVPTHCKAYNKAKEIEGYCKYIMTFDWYQDNELCHMVLMSSGHYMLVPSHKLVFNEFSSGVLPNFKKLHATWKLQ